MSNFIYFISGFLTASIIAFIAAFSYYTRARNRVRAIEQAIHRYNEDSSVVGDAVGKTYGGKP